MCRPADIALVGEFVSEFAAVSCLAEIRADLARQLRGVSFLQPAGHQRSVDELRV